jgi:SAM-dependent methyltransferase
MPYPYRYVPVLTPIYRAARRMYSLRRHAGTAVRCVVCERSFGSWIDSTVCPGCGSETRHRFMWSLLERDWRARVEPVRLLHIAPEECLARRFRSHRSVVFYCTLDRGAPEVDVRADLTATGLADQSFDAVICSHVLEHIQNDRAAMREMLRLLKPGGIAYIQVPCNQESSVTDEDPSITDPLERSRRFGQFDHLRVYGMDIVDRLRHAGFVIEKIRPSDILDTQQMSAGGHWNDVLFRCERSAVSNFIAANGSTIVGRQSSVSS